VPSVDPATKTALCLEPTTAVPSESGRSINSARLSVAYLVKGACKKKSTGSKYLGCPINSNCLMGVARISTRHGSQMSLSEREITLQARSGAP